MAYGKGGDRRQGAERKSKARERRRGKAMTQVAINIADLTRMPPMIAGMLIGEVTHNRQTVNAEKGMVDGMAVVLECEKERAQAIVEVIRTADKNHGRYLTRAYQSGPRGGWKKI
jgi:hypothetical protein